MGSPLPVVAAVPNYNMGEQLEVLLPQLRTQEYADIFVLDDASTDDSAEIVAALDVGAVFVGSEVNQGAGATRNLIIPALSYDAIIHFVDADVDLVSTNVVEAAQELVPTTPFGFIGGLALNPEGTQNVWNYGPRQCLHSDIGAVIQDRIAAFQHTDPDKAIAIRERFDNFLADWPNPFIPPTSRPVFWGIEQNLLFQSKTFAALGGFDAKLREHEIQEVALRMQQAGLERRFDPAIAVQHKAVDVRAYNRRLAQFKAELAIQRKFGVRNWLLPDGSLHPSM